MPRQFTYQKHIKVVTFKKLELPFSRKTKTQRENNNKIQTQKDYGFLKKIRITHFIKKVKS